MLNESCVMFFSPSRAVLSAILRDEYLTLEVGTKEVLTAEVKYYRHRIVHMYFFYKQQKIVAQITINNGPRLTEGGLPVFPPFRFCSVAVVAAMFKGLAGHRRGTSASKAGASTGPERWEPTVSAINSRSWLSWSGEN